MSGETTTTAGLPAHCEEWEMRWVRVVATLKSRLARAGFLVKCQGPRTVSLRVLSFLLEGILAAAETFLTFVLLGGFTGSSVHCPSEDNSLPL